MLGDSRNTDPISEPSKMLRNVLRVLGYTTRDRFIHAVTDVQSFGAMKFLKRLPNTTSYDHFAVMVTFTLWCQKDGKCEVSELSAMFEASKLHKRPKSHDMVINNTCTRLPDKDSDTDCDPSMASFALEVNILKLVCQARGICH